MIGFAEIPSGVNGRCINTYSFTGGGAEYVDYNIPLKGPYSGRFDLRSTPGIYSWSPCGGSTAILNMNTACNITPTKLPALIAVSGASCTSRRPRANSEPGRSYQWQVDREIPH